MVWTTFNPVECIPWATNRMSSTPYDMVWTTPYTVDDMTYPVDAYPVDIYSGYLYHILWVQYPVDISCGEQGISRGVRALRVYSVDTIHICRGCNMWDNTPWMTCCG